MLYNIRNTYLADFSFTANLYDPKFLGGYLMPNYNKRGYLNSDFRIFHLTDTMQKEFSFHYHDFHKITIFIKGNVQYYVEGKTYTLKPYDIVLVNRNDIHRVLAEPGVPYERIIVYISPSFMHAYRDKDYDLSLCFQKAKE